jgi:hypothetical protein
MAAKDSKLMAITPAMREGSGMVEFSRKFPDRYFDVAIAEQHAVTFAAGLAIGGYKPVVAIYSTFLQRAYDQVIHDVAIQKLPVLFAIDRAGIVGADGQTHQGRLIFPSALYPGHGYHDAKRRERMPPDAVYRIPPQRRPERRALPAWQRGWRDARTAGKTAVR